MYNYLLARRPWKPARKRASDQPGQAFKQYFAALGAKDMDAMWLAYREWRIMHQQEELKRFAHDFESAKNALAAKMSQWPNPLKNARQGEHYCQVVNFPDFILKGNFTGLEAAGLTSKLSNDGRSCTIEGTPAQKGEFAISFVYIGNVFRNVFLKNINNPHVLKKFFLRKTFNLVVNPDPRTLWKDLPTDPSLEYFKEDTQASEIFCGGSQLVAASRRGRSHAHAGLPRDDDYGLCCQDNWHILAVADGAGSAPFSREGSRLACLAALDSCRKSLANAEELERLLAMLPPLAEPELWQAQAKKLAYQILPQAFFDAHKAIREAAKQRNVDIKQFATTLLLTMAKKYPGGWIVMSFQIGDGAMAMFHNGAVKLLAEPDEGEFGGQTRFITMKELFEGNELMRRLSILQTDNLEALLLMTDGVSDARFATLANLQKEGLWLELLAELEPMLNGQKAPEELLEWLLFWSQGNHDDRTIAVMRPRPKLAATPRSMALARRPM